MNNRLKGIVAIIVSAFGFALMAMFVRLCDDFGGPVSSFQKGFFRNIIALLIASVVFFRQKDKVLPPLKAYFPLVVRSVCGTVGIFANFYALSRIAIGEGMTLNKTAPFFTVFFSWLFLKERVSIKQVGVLVLAFIGAMLVMKPGFHPSDSFAAGVALLGGLGAGLAYVAVHSLGKMKVNGAFIVLFFSLFSCLSSVPFMCHHLDPMTLAQVIIMIGAGVGAAIGQFGITAAYRFAEPRSIAVYDYSNVIFTALFGFFVFDQVPDCLSVLGFFVILLAGVALVLRKEI